MGNILSLVQEEHSLKNFITLLSLSLSLSLCFCLCVCVLIFLFLILRLNPLPFCSLQGYSGWHGNCPCIFDSSVCVCAILVIHVLFLSYTRCIYHHPSIPLFMLHAYFWEYFLIWSHVDFSHKLIISFAIYIRWMISCWTRLGIGFLLFKLTCLLIILNYIIKKSYHMNVIFLKKSISAEAITKPNTPLKSIHKHGQLQSKTRLNKHTVTFTGI